MWLLPYRVRLSVLAAIVAGARVVCDGSSLGIQAPATASAFRLLRSISGTSGQQVDSNFVVSDPRDAFSLETDTQVLVFMEWSGPPGRYRLSGTWRSPTGTTRTSEYDYTSRGRRFGAYWVLPFIAGMVPGDWVFEARINGAIAGVRQLTIGGAASRVPATPAPEPARVPLTKAELFKRAVAATVEIDVWNAKGERVTEGVGTLLGNGLVITSFDVINDSARLTLRTNDGLRSELTGVLKWDRRADWAILRMPPLVQLAAAVGMTASMSKSVEPLGVGMPCYSLIVSDGASSIVEGEVTGHTKDLGPGQRILTSLVGMKGGPALNEYGDLVGIMSGAATPGLNEIASLQFQYRGNTGLVVPIGLIAEPDSEVSPTALSQLAAQGLFTPRYWTNENVISGGVARGVELNGLASRPIGQADHFSAQEKTITAFVLFSWTKRAMEPICVFRLFDIDNKPVAQSEPKKLSPRASTSTITAWEFSTPSKPGTYRIDMLFNDEVGWRTYFWID